ncbi:serine hydrolase domain-containing protein [Crocosphaera sp.]|uniref:serine hydrolase n=1 Tax=Crocosphaera sp. TaxID=2729996 RepID=UPI00262CA8E7|nr:serine hydrolase domain-containing protein [Crocosphaera sp.]MDJ0580964.1 serine hydrolase domain-containing protein [Crocosphaera sp.]
MAIRQLTPPSTNGKTAINSQNPQDFDLEVFFNRVNQQMRNRFKGFAVILSDPNGDRLGFTRDGWAIDPDDSGSSELFTLNTPTAIGSVTKLFTTVTVLKRSTGAGQYQSLRERLQSRFSHFLPRRWWDNVHQDYRNVTVAELLQHKAGFQKTGDAHISVRLSKPRELDTTPGTRKYSNTSMGIFHFIFAKWGLYYSWELNEAEIQHRNSSTEIYNKEIQKATSRNFNVNGLYEMILKPLEIQASADPNNGKWPVGMSEYFSYGTPARTYSSRTDNTGNLLADGTRNAASGGLYISAKGLAKFISSVKSGPFLTSEQRNLMINNGPEEDLFAFSTRPCKGGFCFKHNGFRSGSHANVLIFPNRFSAVFVANSPDRDLDVQGVLISAYNTAHSS